MFSLCSPLRLVESCSKCKQPRAMYCATGILHSCSNVFFFYLFNFEKSCQLSMNSLSQFFVSSTVLACIGWPRACLGSPGSISLPVREIGIPLRQGAKLRNLDKFEHKQPDVVHNARQRRVSWCWDALHAPRPFADWLPVQPDP